jgi:hypothetical protein
VERDIIIIFYEIKKFFSKTGRVLNKLPQLRREGVTKKGGEAVGVGRGGG